MLTTLVSIPWLAYAGWAAVVIVLVIYGVLHFVVAEDKAGGLGLLVYTVVVCVGVFIAGYQTGHPTVPDGSLVSAEQFWKEGKGIVARVRVKPDDRVAVIDVDSTYTAGLYITSGRRLETFQP
ncbi:MAG: hypothetical protein WCO03_00395 [bacterium]